MNGLAGLRQIDMISELKNKFEKTSTGEKSVFVAELGLINMRYIDPLRKYQGRLYRLSLDAAKAISEIAGFTFQFELGSVKTAHMDIYGTEGLFVLEVERNTKPADIGVRYTKERWSVAEVYGKGSDGLRPWIKTEYEARFLPDKILNNISEQIRLKVEYFDKFFLRVNFKDKIFGLIAPEKYTEHFPAGSFANFTLPNETIQNVESIEGEADLSAQLQKPSNIDEPKSSPSIIQNGGKVMNESQAKYATYSRSEVDQLLKQQTEIITNSLGSKISGQQRAFLEAVAQQEKSFKNLADNFVSQFEAAHNKMQNTTKEAQEMTKSELAEFKRQLNKELEQYRSNINKTILPVAKVLEEKPLVKQSQQKTKEANVNVPANAAALMTWLRSCFFAVIVSAAIICVILVKYSPINDMNTRIDSLSNKVDQLLNKK